MKDLTHYLDTVNRTGTLQMSDEDFAVLSDWYFERNRQKLDSCKTCIVNALKNYVREYKNQA